MNDSDRAPTDDVAASDGTPWIGVHMLTEFIFCRRAGLIAFEERDADTGEEPDDTPRLDYLPDFSIDLIERALQETWNAIWRYLTWAPPVALVTFVIGVVTTWWIGVLLLIVAAAGLTFRLQPKLRRVAHLSNELRIARGAVPKEPAADSTEMQAVNWWELLKAGFTPQQYEDSHEIPEWHFAGRPWRVLVKGSLRIPVFRKRMGEASLHPQHFARMAAYCHLLEVAEGGESPYGVVLFGRGHDGTTVPNTPENMAVLEDNLRGIRKLVDDVKQGGLMPDTPSPPSKCHQCPLGRPREHREGETETEADGHILQPYRTRGDDGLLYHSVCGDRFRWVPPHERAAQKGLC